MGPGKLKALAKAMREEEDPKAKTRMRAVHMVLTGQTARYASERAGVSHGAVTMWMVRHQDKGPDGLKTATNREPSVKPWVFAKEAELLEKQGKLTPKAIRKRIEEKAGYTYSNTSAIRLLHKHGYESTAPKNGRYSRHAHWPWKMA